MTGGPSGSVNREGLVRLADVAPEPVRWLWPGRIPLGKLTLLDGDPGLGKSTLLLDLAARVSRGALMPDEVRSELEGPAGTVLLTAEDGLADTIRPRLDAAGGDPERVAALQSIQAEEGGEPRLPTVQSLRDLKGAIEEMYARLLIVDPLVAYLPGDVNSHRDQDVRTALAPLAELADETGVAVVAVRHLNKGGGSNPKYRGGGSIGLIAAARSGLLVAEDPDAPNDRRILAATKANLCEPAPSLAYSLEGKGTAAVRVAWEGESDHAAHALLDLPSNEEQTARDEAVAILRRELRDAPVPVKELKSLAKEHGIGWRTFRRAKEQVGIEATKQGFSGGWVWKFPEDGQGDGQDRGREKLAGFGDGPENRGSSSTVTPEDGRSREVAENGRGAGEWEEFS